MQSECKSVSLPSECPVLDMKYATLIWHAAEILTLLVRRWRREEL